MAADVSDLSCELCTHRATIIGVADDDDIDLALCACCFRALLQLTDEIVSLIVAGIVPSAKELFKLRAAASN